MRTGRASLDLSFRKLSRILLTYLRSYLLIASLSRLSIRDSIDKPLALLRSSASDHLVRISMPFLRSLGGSMVIISSYRRKRRLKG